MQEREPICANQEMATNFSRSGRQAAQAVNGIRESKNGRLRRRVTSTIALNKWPAFSLALLLLVVPYSVKASDTPPPVQIPRDEAPHQYETEWWYFSGHLTGFDPSGKAHSYGYELVFFQFNFPGQAEPVYQANLAVTDITGGTFRYEQKIQPQPIPDQKDGFNLNIAPWHIQGSSGFNALAADFTDGSYGIRLAQTSLQPVVLHGDNGLIPYGPFGTSFYYSWTNLWTLGTVLDHGVPVTVIGDSWMDHQWYNPLGLGGWTWFGIQLSNSTQYMLYFIRDGNNRLAQIVATEVKNGRTIHLSPSAVSETPTGSWTSPVTGITYPSGWKVTVPGGVLTVTPLQKDQELAVAATLAGAYWEGDSTVSGVVDGLPVRGKAYAEVAPVPVPGSTPLPPAASSRR